MFQHQRDWWDLPNFVRMFVAGYGAGKTMMLCKRMISLALVNAPIPVAIVSPTYAMASETVITTLIELLDGRRALDKYFRWEDRKGSPYRFFITYRGRTARILVYSGEKPDRLKGPNLAAAGVDEPFIQEIAVFEQMIARIRHVRAKRLELNLTGTPEELNWGFELADGELKDRYDVGLVRSSSRDNLALASGYVDRMLEGYDAKTAEAFVDGRFVNLAKGRIFFAFNPDEHVATLEPPPGAQHIAGMDFNVNPMAFVVGWTIGDKLYWSHEYEFENSDTAEACSAIRKNHPLVRDVYPDASGRNRATNAPGGASDLAIIKQFGLHPYTKHSGNPPRRDRFNAANGMFKPAQGEARFFIHPRCKKLRSYLQQLSYERLTKQENMTHLTDAATYAPAYLFSVRRGTDGVRAMTGA